MNLNSCIARDHRHFFRKSGIAQRHCKCLYGRTLGLYDEFRAAINCRHISEYFCFTRRRSRRCTPSPKSRSLWKGVCPKARASIVAAGGRTVAAGGSGGFEQKLRPRLKAKHPSALLFNMGQLRAIGGMARQRSLQGGPKNRWQVCDISDDWPTIGRIHFSRPSLTPAKDYGAGLIRARPVSSSLTLRKCVGFR